MLSTFNKYLYKLNDSKYFAGIMYILLNIGSRFIQLRFSKSTEMFIKSAIFRELLIFSIAWMGTRDLYMALFLTATFIILSDFLLNTDSRFCVLPEKYKKLNSILDDNKDGEVSELEISNAITILERAKKQNREQKHIKILDYYNLIDTNEID